MKKILVVFSAMLFMCVISCGKGNEAAKQKASETKKFGQYEVFKGEMESGGIGYVLKSDSTAFRAMRNTKNIYTDKAVFKVKLKAHQQANPRNGFIQAVSSQGQIIEAGVLIGAGKYQLGGNAVEKKEIAVKFDANMVCPIELKIDIKKKEVTAIIDGKILRSKITQQFTDIKQVGYVGYTTQSEFTEIEEPL